MPEARSLKAKRSPLRSLIDKIKSRHQVLVIESGEIELPGEVRMRNIGLPPGVVYACLAETVVLALEGRYETFTIGRNIEWEKVKEIYRLGLKHGMKLATISGVNPSGSKGVPALRPRRSKRVKAVTSR